MLNYIWGTISRSGHLDDIAARASAARQIHEDALLVFFDVRVLLYEVLWKTE